MDYKKQGEDFLLKTETSFQVERAVPQKSPLWSKKGEKHGINYSVTLKNKRHAYTFDFWNSISRAEMLSKAEEINSLQAEHSPLFFAVSDFLKEETGKPLTRIDLMTHKVIGRVEEAIKPTAYDILACLNPLSEDTFEDFCSSYGYDTDSRMALDIYHSCLEQDRHISKLFNEDEMELLAEIN